MSIVMSSTASRRRSTLRAVIAWGVVAFALAASITSMVLVPTTPLDAIPLLLVPSAFGGIGAFLSVRVPGNPIGPMLLAATAGFSILIVSSTYVAAVVVLPSTDPAAIVAGLLSNLTFIPSLVIVIVGIPLVFPDGHFLSRRWRWVAVASATVVVAAELRVLLSTPELATQPGLRNPFYVEAVGPLFEVSNTLESLAALPLFALAVGSLVVRYRRSDSVGRHQVRWLAASSAVAAVGFACSFFAPRAVEDVVAALSIIALSTIPISIGVAIVRYRLYDIDRLISRGISYGLVTVVLLATYVAIVLVLQGPLGSVFGTQTVTVAISTLIVASLFQPLRRRVHRAVDRRFDRARVDTERTAAAFSDRLRAEVDIDAVVGDLAATASGAVRPTGITVWLREPANS